MELETKCHFRLLLYLEINNSFVVFLSILGKFYAEWYAQLPHFPTFTALRDHLFLSTLLLRREGKNCDGTLSFNLVFFAPFHFTMSMWIKYQSHPQVVHDSKDVRDPVHVYPLNEEGGNGRVAGGMVFNWTVTWFSDDQVNLIATKLNVHHFTGKIIFTSVFPILLWNKSRIVIN